MEKTTGEADIQENKLKELSPDLLNTLLKDHKRSKGGKQCNISGLLPIMNRMAKVMNTGRRFSGIDNGREWPCSHAPCPETQRYPKHTFPGNGRDIDSVLDM